MTTTPPLPSVPIRSAEELTDRWTGLLAPLVFDRRSLWLSWIGDAGLMLPVVIPIDDLPALPDPTLLMGIRQVDDSIVESQLDGEGHLAMALCRRGRPEITAGDDEWAEEFRSMFDDGQIDGSWSLHLAAGGTVVPVVGMRA